MTAEHGRKQTDLCMMKNSSLSQQNTWVCKLPSNCSRLYHLQLIHALTLKFIRLPGDIVCPTCTYKMLTQVVYPSCILQHCMALRLWSVLLVTSCMRIQLYWCPAPSSSPPFIFLCSLGRRGTAGGSNASTTHPLWFRFNEGFSNAVRRPIRIQDLL